MKTSGACPKCSCAKLYVVEEVTQPDNESSNSTVPFFMQAARLSQRDTGVTEGTSYRSQVGKFETWICSGCGFTEWYAKDLNEIGLLARHWGGGIRVVTSPPRPAYR